MPISVRAYRIILIDKIQPIFVKNFQNVKIYIISFFYNFSQTITGAVKTAPVTPNYLPATERLSTSTLGEPKAVMPVAEGSSTLVPTAVIFFKSSKKLPATVKDFTGVVFLPFSIMKPALCREKSPVTGFAPACRPLRELIYTPFPAFSKSSSSVYSPAARYIVKGRMPTAAA